MKILITALSILLLAGIAVPESVSGSCRQDTIAADADFLRKFAFICTLSFDVYLKKLMIEKMIDELRAPGKADVKKKKLPKQIKPERMK